LLTAGRAKEFKTRIAANQSSRLAEEIALCGPTSVDEAVGAFLLLLENRCGEAVPRIFSAELERISSAEFRYYVTNGCAKRSI